MNQPASAEQEIAAREEETTPEELRGRGARAKDEDRERYGEGLNIPAMLLQEGFVTSEQISKAHARQKTNGHKLGYNLIELGYVDAKTITRMLERQFRIPGVELDAIDVDPTALKLIPVEIARKYEVFPVRRNGNTIVLAMGDPTDWTVVDDLKFLTGYEIEPVVADEYSIIHAIGSHYEAEGEGAYQQLLENLDEFEMEVVEEEEEEEDVNVLAAQVEAAPVVKFINSLLADAVQRGASDIHIEPYEDELRIRYRIDGVLREMLDPPVRMKAAIISRLKILADLNIAERRVPQDGRIKMKMANRVIDFRVSTLPTLFGEKIVLRILDKSALTLDLEKLGFPKASLRTFLKAIEAPYGIVLVTGPTGSGKTTTLYSALTRLNQPRVNIMTAEDPVEYNLQGINQVQVNEEVGLDFASSLRAFLRQDPNIVMVGEIRDYDTGSIAIKAALTGHLVLSTIHTNDAPSTVNRMVDMGLQSFLVASALNCVVAQRLVRRICSHCKAPRPYPPEALEEAGFEGEDLERVYYEGEGCTECDDSGYRGRIGIYEVMPITSAMKQLITNQASTEEIRARAAEDGMITLRKDGKRKMREGITTLDEVLRETSLS
ncbi:MAG: type IV-A pilus assembly ATPase PilB [Gemmatimonadota bacterium]|nr:type IV-A pilus assembly ATPase PilB [Gemmatimonadota bacterium]